MKKGISLIVLVITIIVMIIIAGAIIISLNSSNVINQSNEAVEASDRANATALLSMEYAEILGAHYVANPTVTYVANTTDCGTLDTNVKAATKGDWGVRLTTDKTGYEVYNLHTTPTGSNSGSGVN